MMTTTLIRNALNAARTVKLPYTPVKCWQALQMIVGTLSVTKGYDMEKLMGRNIAHNPRLNQWTIITEVDGKLQLVNCNNQALAEATFRRLKRNGYHYFDAHKDTTA